MEHISEKTFEKKLKEYLHSVGIYQAGTPKQKKSKEQVGWFIKFWGGGMSQSGIPDIIGCARGVFFAFELKASDGRPSKLQEINVKEIQKSGGLSGIVYPEDFEKIKKILNKIIDKKQEEVK